MIHEKAVAEATISDLEEELRAIGCTDIASRKDEVSRWTVFTVTYETRKFTISFSPASAGITLTAEQVKGFAERRAAVRREGGFFIAVESADEQASLMLIRRIVRSKPR